MPPASTRRSSGPISARPTTRRRSRASGRWSKLLVALGYSDEDIRKMISLNAMRLAGLGANTAPAAKH